MDEFEASNVLPRLYERDIDVLLQEELIFNEGVRRLFSTALELDETFQVLACRLSVVDASGETDVLATISVGSRRGFLLVENKIDASFQPRQPERYRERTANLVTSGESCEVAFCALIAPKNYIREEHADFAHFDAIVSYEDLAAAIEALEEPRSRHRATLLRRAVDQARHSYVLVEAPAVTSLWQRIYEIASSEYPTLEMKRPNDKGSNSSWVIFKGSLPPKVTIDWKIKKATVDLSFWPGALKKPPDTIDLAALTTGITSGKPVLQTLGATRVITVPLSRPPSDFVGMSDELIGEALKTAVALRIFYHEQKEIFV
ncbi:PD-(D/E)XK nuclease family protein [Mesorhizobium sp. CO1-1-8]|uniref:PD-(D/E)XK nuclease family protein n=1 Tax=Mesorhizobium sp. CO1-1-8 TaxID=2876631 RepID=UPI001CD11C49|nr:PD-(D/E)XK nuclease family protein [Mesorhizobium sp. CO1-1-8]MBZ9774021.1 PD-(D/E)XK nuclease family protein [Mesorhizobium sp. CO1-1-8]